MLSDTPQSTHGIQHYFQHYKKREITAKRSQIMSHAHRLGLTKRPISSVSVIDVACIWSVSSHFSF